MTDKNEEECEKRRFTLTQAAKLMHITRQGVYVAIRKRGLKAELVGRQWYIKEEDLIEYQKGKYSREKSAFEGNPLFDLERGEYSVNHTAKILGCPAQHIYYLIRNGELNPRKRGSAWVISREEIEVIYYKRFASHPERQVSNA